MTQVSAQLEYDVVEAATVVLQLGVASGTGHLAILNNGATVMAEHIGGGQMLAEVAVGELAVHYSGVADPIGMAASLGTTPLTRVEALRPSRYCPSDRMGGYATSRFGHYEKAHDTVLAICDHVAQYVIYTSGSSDANTDAADTLLSGEGVCRDYAQLVAALCRAVGVPARVASVYAPGLDPMDFHLVVEADIDGSWRVWDATRLAPRQSLVRISTGRDAADVAFSTFLTGRAEPTLMEIVAVADRDLPLDDHRALVSLA